MGRPIRNQSHPRGLAEASPAYQHLHVIRLCSTAIPRRFAILDLGLGYPDACSMKMMMREWSASIRLLERLRLIMSRCWHCDSQLAQLLTRHADACMLVWNSDPFACQKSWQLAKQARHALWGRVYTFEINRKPTYVVETFY